MACRAHLFRMAREAALISGTSAFRHTATSRSSASLALPLPPPAAPAGPAPPAAAAPSAAAAAVSHAAVPSSEAASPPCTAGVGTAPCWRPPPEPLLKGLFAATPLGGKLSGGCCWVEAAGALAPAAKAWRSAWDTGVGASAHMLLLSSTGRCESCGWRGGLTGATGGLGPAARSSSSKCTGCSTGDSCPSSSLSSNGAPGVPSRTLRCGCSPLTCPAALR